MSGWLGRIRLAGLVSLRGPPFGHRLVAFAAIATGAEELQVVLVIGAAAGERKDMIDAHPAEGEVDVAADADAFLFAVEAMAMRAVVGEFAEVGAAWRFGEGVCSAPEAAFGGGAAVGVFFGDTIISDAAVDELDGQRRDIDPGPLALEAIGSDKSGGAAAEWIEYHVSRPRGCLDDPLEQSERFLGGVTDSLFAAYKGDGPPIFANHAFQVDIRVGTVAIFDSCVAFSGIIFAVVSSYVRR